MYQTVLSDNCAVAIDNIIFAFGLCYLSYISLVVTLWWYVAVAFSLHEPD
jgi:hypothetical protein